MKKLMARPLCCGCALVLGMVGTAAGQIFSLEDATRRVGIETASYVAPFGMTAGVAAADYNNNGWIDIFVPNAEGHADQLFVNNGDGTFTEMALDLGVSGMDHPLGKPRSRVALWVDVDGDRRLDLIVAAMRSSSRWQTCPPTGTNCGCTGNCPTGRLRTPARRSACTRST